MSRGLLVLPSVSAELIQWSEPGASKYEKTWPSDVLT